MNFIEQMKLHDEKVVEITLDCIDLQVSCMLLLHEACLKIKQDEIEDGLLMMAALYAMRDSYNEQRKKFIEVFGEEDVLKTYKKVDGDKIVYSLLSDEVIKCNNLYFDVPTRPEGEEYHYDSALSSTKRKAALQKFFPSALKAA